jgi:pimeloyl-ACP methyl ester carboxylesterase
MPRTSVRIAQELHSALRNTGAKGPYILVGHAFGGDNVRTFANLYMREVAGLVLVEADPDDLLPKQMQEDNHRGHAKLLLSVRECRDAVAAGSPCRRCRHVPDRRNAPALSSSFAVCPRRHGPPN